MSDQGSKRTAGLAMAEDNEIHLWSLNLERYGLENVATGKMLLDARETERGDRFTSPAARHRYQLARTLVRSVLSGYFPDVDPCAWRFASNAHGKPAIASPQPGRPLFFNLSHCASRIVLAVAGWPGLGVDAEKVIPRPAALAVARRHFCSSEYQFLCDMAPEQRRVGFYEFWTLKEAFSKACGGPLVPALKKLELGFPGTDEIAASIAPDAGEPAGDWQLWLFEEGDHRVALAMHSDHPVTPVSCLVRELDDPLCPDRWRESRLRLRRWSRRVETQ